MNKNINIPMLMLLTICGITPGLSTFLYFNAPQGTNQLIYLASKVVILVIPIIWYVKVGKSMASGFKQNLCAGLKVNIVFSTLTVAGIALLYYFQLKGSEVELLARENLSKKLAEFSITTTFGFWSLALFTSFINSLFEEYFWRWFFWQWSDQLLTLKISFTINGIFFSLHHIVVLLVYFPSDNYLSTAIPFSLATSVGALYWCWHYSKYKSFAQIWLSHIIIDLAIMAVGNRIIFEN